MKPKWIVLTLVLLGFLIRAYFILAGDISFHFDMARDAYFAEQIYRFHHLKILGPSTKLEGIYSGVGYYYLLAVPYFFSSGDPRGAALFFSILSSLAVIPLFLIAREILKSDRWALLAGSLFAIGYDSLNYGPWVSNPAPAFWSVILFYFFLYQSLKKKSWAIPLASFMAVFSAQMEFFQIYLLVVLVIFIRIFKVKLTRNQILISLGLILLGLSTYLISWLKFGMWSQTVSAFTKVSGSGGLAIFHLWSRFASPYLLALGKLFSYNFSPTLLQLGLILALLVLFFSRNKFIIFLLLSNSLLFLFGGDKSNYVYAGLALPATIGVVILLKKLWRYGLVAKLAMVILLVLSGISNYQKIFTTLINGEPDFSIQRSMILRDQLNLIDKSYQIAHNQPFSFNSLTEPAWTNTTWAYLYHWYGLKKYGYLPSFDGRDQSGIPGGEYITQVKKPNQKTFFIRESGEGLSAIFIRDELDTENYKTNLLNIDEFGTLRLEERVGKGI